jgi:hypothetical protein
MHLDGNHMLVEPQRDAALGALNDMRLPGTHPLDLGWLTGLEWVSLGGNRLSGSLPTSIGLWANLTSIQIAWNQLSGTIPTSILQWTVLKTALLHHNV